MTDVVTDRAIQEAYSKYMSEINHRMDVIEALFSGESRGNPINVYFIADLELIYLQVRKILELTMFASLSAHSAAQTIFEKKAHKAYKATEVLAFVKKKNKFFFPKAIDFSPDNNEYTSRLQPNGDPVMTEAEFRSFYSKSIGGMMHANKSGGLSKEQQIFAYMELRDLYSKLISLLGYHAVQLSDGRLVITYAFKNGDKPGWVNVISPENGPPLRELFR